MGVVVGMVNGCGGGQRQCKVAVAMVNGCGGEQRQFKVAVAMGVVVGNGGNGCNGKGKWYGCMVAVISCCSGVGQVAHS